MNIMIGSHIFENQSGVCLERGCRRQCGRPPERLRAHAVVAHVMLDFGLILEILKGFCEAEHGVIAWRRIPDSRQDVGCKLARVELMESPRLRRLDLRLLLVAARG